MKIARGLSICLLAGSLLPALAQKSQKPTDTAALEKELYAVELQWMKAEHDKNRPLMTDLWTDSFFDILPDGKVVSKQEMMDMMVKADAKPGTGAFPDNFKIRAIYGNVVLATDHTVIKGLDSSGKIVPVMEMSVLRMFVREKGKWRVAGAGLVPLPK
jgi:hypothetical protein